MIKVFGFAFPNGQNLPALGLKLLLIISIACNIAAQLRSPIILPRARDPAVTACVQMPKTAMHKNHLAAAGKHQIRLARQIFAVQAATVAQLVREFANNHLRLHVFAADPPHILAAALN